MAESKYACDEDDDSEEEEESQQEERKKEEACDLLGMDAFAGDFQQMAEIRKEQKIAFKVRILRFHINRSWMRRKSMQRRITTTLEIKSSTEIN